MLQDVASRCCSKDAGEHSGSIGQTKQDTLRNNLNKKIRPICSASRIPLQSESMHWQVIDGLMYLELSKMSNYTEEISIYASQIRN